MAISPQLYREVASVLKEAGRDDLAREMQAAVQPDETLTSSQAAQILGVSSTNTVKNWLKNGMFAGAYQTDGGHWRFPRSEVEKVRAQMEALHEKNRRGDLAPSDDENPQDPPLL